MSKWIRKTSIDQIFEELLQREEDLIFCIDSQVERSFSHQVAKLKEKYNSRWFAFPQGENAKNFAEWERALEFFIERGVSRKSHLMAIGGGALSDVAGFVAATLLRGISWSVVPTTLLSQVDASIGGKVAINTRHGKNLVGSFHPPKEIFICQDFQEKLDKKNILSGKGEILKYAFLDSDIEEIINDDSSMEHIVDACANMKLALVERDLLESGDRKLLNLGHTFGHGIEWLYGVSHGEAVIWGLALIFIIQEQPDQLKRLKNLMTKLGIVKLKTPWTSSSWNQEKIIEIVRKDKKSLNQQEIDIIIIDKNNNPKIIKMAWDDIIVKIEEKREEILALSLS